MSTVDAAAAASDPAPVDAEPGLAPIADRDAKEQIECANSRAPAFLYSPPDSNDVVKTDASDSELSDLDDEPVLDGPPPAPPAPQLNGHCESDKQQGDPDHDEIGDVSPDHWSGNVPVFRPTMRQFNDFQRFVRNLHAKPRRHSLTLSLADERGR